MGKRQTREMTYMLREIRRLGEGTLTVGALERLVAIVGTLVDREGTSDGKRFSTAGIVANIRSWKDNSINQMGYSIWLKAAYVLACAYAYAELRWPPPRNAACTAYIGTVCARYGSGKLNWVPSIIFSVWSNKAINPYL